MTKQAPGNHQHHLMASWLAAFLIALAAIPAAAEPRLVPFQARLTDGTGVSLTGVYRITFAIYDEPTGGTALWSEVHDNVSVLDGHLNVLLGSLGCGGGGMSNLDDPDCNGNPEDAVRFDEARFVGVRVGADTNLEMIPRHQLVPAFHARTADRAYGADDSQKLGGYDEAHFHSISVPIGGVIMWWGYIANIPTNFELCDGTDPLTPGATLAGPKPNLMDRFVKGAAMGVADVRSAPPGGTHSYSLTNNQLPSHTHGHTLAVGSDGNHSHTITKKAKWGDHWNGEAGFSHDDGTTWDHAFETSDSGAHGHGFSGSISSAGNNGPIDNRPAYLELFYIIRVK